MDAEPSEVARPVVVLGLGNPIRGDDAVGLCVADALAGRLRHEPIAGVVVRTSSRAGLELLDLLTDACHAIVIDAYEGPDAVPGRVRRLDAHHAAGAARLIGAHDLTLMHALELGRIGGVVMPDTLEIVAIDVVDTMSIKEGLSSAIARLVPLLADEIHRHLRAV